MKFFPSSIVLAAIALASPVLSSIALAADVNWGAPQDITGNSDVSTSGSLIGAFNVGNTGVPSSTLVSGVNFQGFAAPSGNGTMGNYALVSSNSFASNINYGSANAPFANLTVNYQAILMSGISAGGPFTLTISGLITGMQYQFQSWTNGSSDNDFGTSLTGGNNTSDLLHNNVPGMPGGLGQFVIGTFTADSITQTIKYGVDEVAYLNAFQLRQVNVVSAVPDSGSSFLLLLLALVGLSLSQRLRNRAGACSDPRYLP